MGIGRFYVSLVGTGLYGPDTSPFFKSCLHFNDPSRGDFHDIMHFKEINSTYNYFALGESMRK